MRATNRPIQLSGCRARARSASADAVWLSCIALVLVGALLRPPAAAATNNSLSFWPGQWATIPHQPSLNFSIDEDGTIEMWFWLGQSTLDHHLMGKRSGCGFDSNFYQFATRSGPDRVEGGWRTGCVTGSTGPMADRELAALRNHPAIPGPGSVWPRCVGSSNVPERCHAQQQHVFL